MATGDGLYHFYAAGSTTRRSPTPPCRLRAALNEGTRSSVRPSARPRARPAGRGVRRAAPRGGASGLRRSFQPLADGLPVRRGAQVLLRLLVPDALVEQGARVRRAARAARLPRGHGGRVPARPPRGRERARRAAADLGDRRHRARAEALATDRRPPARAAARSSAIGRRRRRSGRRPRRSPTRR